MISLADLPTLNCLLNATSSLLLLTGYWSIRKREIRWHRLSMSGALAASALFLTCYLIYHYHVGSKPFTGQGFSRITYFAILISHAFLAVGVAPLVVITVTQAFRRKFEKHRRLARWTFPLWLYVSASGVAIYLMLYVFVP